MPVFFSLSMLFDVLDVLGFFLLVGCHKLLKNGCFIPEEVLKKSLKFVLRLSDEPFSVHCLYNFCLYCKIM